MENDKKPPTEGYEQIDQLFRKNLAGQQVEPGKGLWNGINRKLLFREMIRFNFTNLSGTFWIAGIAAIVIIPVILYLTLTPGRTIPANPTPSSQKTQTVHQTIGSNPAGSQRNSFTEKPSVISSKETNSVTKAAVDQPLIAKTPGKTEPATSMSVNKDKKPYEVKQKTSSALTSKNTTTRTRNQQNSESPVDLASNSTTRLSSSLNEKSQHPFISDPSIQPMTSITYPYSSENDTSRYGRPNLVNLGIYPASYKENELTPQYFSLSVGFMPDMTFYKAASSYSKINYWLGLDLAYHLWKFYIRPGITIGYMYDNGSYSLNYKRNDSIGFYYKVVSYTIDPKHPGVIIYNTVKRTVYDSVVHNGKDQTRNRYQFIQVPLIFGYDIIDTKKFGLSMQAGPVVSFFLAEKETISQNTDLTDARLLDRVKSTPPGKNPNWQIWAGIHLDYRISESFGLYLEPTYKYYFNPVVENDVVSVKAPWAIGLGIGCRYNFGFNTQRP